MSDVFEQAIQDLKAEGVPDDKLETLVADRDGWLENLRDHQVASVAQRFLHAATGFASIFCWRCGAEVSQRMIQLHPAADGMRASVGGKCHKCGTDLACDDVARDDRWQFFAKRGCDEHVEMLAAAFGL